MKIAGSCVPILAASLAVAGTNDYPTEARADYVFVCMKTNGETPDMLRRCSCSINPARPTAGGSFVCTWPPGRPYVAGSPERTRDGLNPLTIR